MKNFGISGYRYCGGIRDDIPYEETLRGRNWHFAIHEESGRAYRCSCMREFRLPDGKNGPCGFPRKKAWRARPSKYNIGKNLPGYN